MFNNIKTLALSGFFIFSLFLTPTVFAQDINDPVFENGVNNDTGAFVESDNSILDWWWLLPLIAIPLYLAYRDGATTRDRRFGRDEGDFVGVKGGRSRKKDDDFKEV